MSAQMLMRKIEAAFRTPPPRVEGDEEEEEEESEAEGGKVGRLLSCYTCLHRDCPADA
jgi:hypothetical protein